MNKIMGNDNLGHIWGSSGDANVDTFKCKNFVDAQDENMPPKVPKLIESPWRARLQDALASGSASLRLKAIHAINTGRMDKLSSFDVPHGSQEIVTDEDRRAAVEAQNVTIADIMEGVCVYVEVRSEREDRSESIKTVIAGMGIRVNDKFYTSTTHVVFKEGRLSTYTKAKQRGIPIVSILWIEACRKSLTLVDPQRFMPHDLECYENPELYKLKRHKFIRCEADSPHRMASKSLGTPPCTATTPKMRETPCDTPETKHINKILVEKKTAPIVVIDDTPTPRRSTRRASTGHTSAHEALTPLKSLRKSLSMELTLPGSQNDEKMKLEQITECDEMDLEIPPHRQTILTRESMIESPHVTDVLPKPQTTINNEATMEIIEETMTPNKLIFSSTATPGSSRRATMFHHRIQLINSSAKTEKKSTEEVPPVLLKTPVDVPLKGKPRRRTLCPLPTVQTFPEISRKDDSEKVESQPKRRKLFHHQEPPIVQTPKNDRRKTMGHQPPKPHQGTTRKDDKRRSTLEFEETPTKEAQKKKPTTIVITNIYGKDKNFVEEGVKKLGVFTMERTVTRATSHLVTQNPARTLNMMRALIRGVWIVNLDWVKESVAAGKWLPEEPFEIQKFSPAVRKNRCERQVLGSGFKMNLLRDTEPIYVSPRCSVPQKEMQELIILCGGRITPKAQATIIVGAKGTQCPNGATCITSSWILDSILACRVLPFATYATDAAPGVRSNNSAQKQN